MNVRSTNGPSRTGIERQKNDESEGPAVRSSPEFVQGQPTIYVGRCPTRRLRKDIFYCTHPIFA